MKLYLILSSLIFFFYAYIKPCELLPIPHFFCAYRLHAVYMDFIHSISFTRKFWRVNMEEKIKRVKLTKRLIDSITSPENGQVFLRDISLVGFAVRVTHGSK